MAGQRDVLQEMEEEFSMITLEDEESGGITYDENDEDLSEIDTKWCLVGRFLTESTILPCYAA